MSNAQAHKRIKYYSQQPHKPIIISPASDSWFNATTAVGMSLQWEYVDFDVQASFTLQISSQIASDGELQSPWQWPVAQETSSLGVVTLAQLYANGYTDLGNGSTIAAQSGIRYWRVKVKGVTKSIWSDYSEIGTINVDCDSPIVQGIDIICPLGWDDTNKLPVAESHSNFIVPSTPPSTGFYLGFTDYLAAKIVANNISGSTKVFYGTVTFSDPVHSIVASNFIAASMSGNNTNYHIKLKDPVVAGTTPGFEFIAMVGNRQKFEIRVKCVESTNVKYNLHISNSTALYDPQGLTSLPEDSAPQLSSAVVHGMVFIGGANTPSVSYVNRTLTLSKPNVSMYLPVGENNYVNNAIENNVEEIYGANTIVSNAVDSSKKTIKVGDSLSMQRTYDKYQRNQKYANKLDPDSLYSSVRDYFTVTSVDYTNKRISLAKSDEGFDTDWVNRTYPPTVSHYKRTKEITDVSVTTRLDKIIYSDGTYKTRTVSDIAIVDENFYQAYRLGTMELTTKNELSNRWFGLRSGKTSNDFVYFPIMSSDESILTVYGDVDLATICPGADSVEYKIAGDSFVVSNNVFMDDLTQAKVYVGCSDSLSGIQKYRIYKQTSPVVEGTDFASQKMNYVDRNITTDITTETPPYKTVDTSSSNITKSDDIFTDVQYKCYIQQVIQHGSINTQSFIKKSDNTTISSNDVIFNKLYDATGLND